MTADSVDEVGADLGGQQPGEARLAGAGRAPQEQRREVAAGDAPAERPALADEVLLADELVEVARPHPGGERLALGRWLEEGLGSGARRRGGHAPSLVPRGAIRSPPWASRDTLRTARCP